MAGDDGHTCCENFLFYEAEGVEGGRYEIFQIMDSFVSVAELLEFVGICALNSEGTWICEFHKNVDIRICLA